MRLIISFAALLMSVVLVQLGSGSLAPLDALSGAALGFSAAEIGLLGSAHFVGFFVGCWLAPRMTGTIGHVRVFAAFAASGAIGALAHPLWHEPWFWAVLRMLTGFAVAGSATVIEGWLQARVTNDTRGRVIGVYRVVDLGAALAAQAMISFLPPATFVSYNIVACMCCLCLVPLTLTSAPEPEKPETPPRLRPLKTLRLSPLGAAGVFVAGITMPAFRMVGPLYGLEVGLDANGIALFLSAAILGGALAQAPVGWLADKHDRRWVLVWLSVAAMAVCLGVAWIGGASPAAIYGGALVFGLVSYPIYSVSSAHANDFAEPQEAIELNASLLFIYAMGAILAPFFSARLIEAAGPSSLFVFIAAAHVALAVIGFWRMRARPPAAEKTPYVYTPRSSFIVDRLLGRRR
ncbi:MFS transporter [Albimonas pacifica]|uniref:Predicted arabinose efflux permease, MFS family n=1 Tax=Albimonas pacifica TaxID=1114924 RepID=A0A1I3GDH7_9RHOB|nr:MFS transporter [Albimonas pacifica]SFI21540.1 Predicted arabinose efflux permease, MFS family [Albimonas pacifica]